MSSNSCKPDQFNNKTFISKNQNLRGTNTHTQITETTYECILFTPRPPIRQNSDIDDYLEHKREDYWNCHYCLLHMHTLDWQFLLF